MNAQLLLLLLLDLCCMKTVGPGWLHDLHAVGAVTGGKKKGKGHFIPLKA